MISALEEDRMEREQRHFDWLPMNDNRMAMLRSLRDTCKDCVMCPLGRGIKVVNGERIDQHVFSTMSPSKFMVIGQNPGLNECKQDEPFVGDAGKNFTDELTKYGLVKKDFYVSNIVKCYTDNNDKPRPEHIDRCKLFLLMEVNILLPDLIVTLGKPSFEFLCPDAMYAKALGKLTYSPLVDKKVFAVYHPSPRNMAIEERKLKYIRQMELLCKMVKFLRQTKQTERERS